MTVVVGGSSPQITFADSTVQNTAALPLTGGSVSADITVHGLTVGLGGGSVSTNTALGASALFSNSTGTNSVAVGYAASYYQTGNSNTSLGHQSFQGQSGLSTGTNNTALGKDTLYSNTTGAYNIAVGEAALRTNTTASNNTAVGYQAGYTQTTATQNTLLGYQAGYLTTGSYNCFVGTVAGYSTTGQLNSFLGYGAGTSVTSGSKNTIIGAYSGNQGGLDIRTSNNVVVLSDGDGNVVGGFGFYPNGAGAYAVDSTARLTVGNGTTRSDNAGTLLLSGNAASGRGPYISGFANGSGSWVIGSYSAIVSGTNQYFTCQNTSGGVYLNGSSATSWTAVSDETRKVIIEDITDGLNKVSTLRAIIGRLKTDDNTIRRPYLIAQDVQKVLPEAVSESEDKEGPVLGLSYTEVIPLLVASIKELNNLVTAQATEIATLKAKVGI